MSDTRRLNVPIPDELFRRVSAYAALKGLTMPDATSAVLAAGLDALHVPRPEDLQPERKSE